LEFKYEYFRLVFCYGSITLLKKIASRYRKQIDTILTAIEVDGTPLPWYRRADKVVAFGIGHCYKLDVL
jgi:hypothetical protein